MSKLTAEELANEFSNFVNNYNRDDEAFVNAFFRQHRTLQQSMFGLMFKVIEKGASGDIGTDPRNQASIDKCKEIVEAFRTNYIESLVDSGWKRGDALNFVTNKASLTGLPHI